MVNHRFRRVRSNGLTVIVEPWPMCNRPPSVTGTRRSNYSLPDRRGRRRVVRRTRAPARRDSRQLSTNSTTWGAAREGSGTAISFTGATLAEPARRCGCMPISSVAHLPDDQFEAARLGSSNRYERSRTNRAKVLVELRRGATSAPGAFPAKGLWKGSKTSRPPSFASIRTLGAADILGIAGKVDVGSSIALVEELFRLDQSPSRRNDRPAGRHTTISTRIDADADRHRLRQRSYCVPITRPGRSWASFRRHELATVLSSRAGLMLFGLRHAQQPARPGRICAMPAQLSNEPGSPADDAAELIGLTVFRRRTRRCEARARLADHAAESSCREPVECPRLVSPRAVTTEEVRENRGPDGRCPFRSHRQASGEGLHDSDTGPEPLRSTLSFMRRGCGCKSSPSQSQRAQRGLGFSAPVRATRPTKAGAFSNTWSSKGPGGIRPTTSSHLDEVGANYNAIHERRTTLFYAAVLPRIFEIARSTGRYRSPVAASG